MKKFIPIVFCSILLFSEKMNAQAFTEGDQVLSLGLGVGTVGYLGYAGTYGFSPALSVSYDKGLKDLGVGTLGVGGIVAFKHVSSAYYSDKYRWTDMIVAGRISFHLNEIDIDELDVYAAVHPGLRIQTYRHNYSGTFWVGPYSSSGIGVHLYLGASVGCSYYITPKIGVFTELGYEFYFAKFGVNFKL